MKLSTLYFCLLGLCAVVAFLYRHQRRLVFRASRYGPTYHLALLHRHNAGHGEQR